MRQGERQIDAGGVPLRPGPGLHVAVTLAVALVCLVAGLLMPIMEVSNLWIFHGSYSIVDGVRILVETGDILIAVILTAFSIVMPMVKIGVLLLLWQRLRAGSLTSSRLPAVFEAIGKWSMLDVFVVAVVVVVAKASALADAGIGPAVFPFTVAVVLMFYCTRKIRRALADKPPVAPHAGG
ncbi:MAG: paraquat-inducible protein A [Rhodospirillales bacterium]|nr:paraquat-inducible protein A [Rhodospirillales bacterium]